MVNNQIERPLPEGWVWATLEECVDILDNLRVPINSDEREQRIAGKEQSELFPYYGATGMVGWIDDFIFDEEIVLLGEDGAPFLETKNKAYIVRGKCWVNNHAHVLRAKKGVTTNLFLMHYLNIFDYHGYVTGTTRLKLNQGRMREFPVILPPLIEQERIVARLEELLSDLDAGVAALERVRAGAKRYKASVLKSVYEGQLFGEVGKNY
jgi:type I restriction enzyme S subunit